MEATIRETNDDIEVHPELLQTQNEFAESEGVSLRTVQRWIKEGRVSVIERLGKRYIDPSQPISDTRQRDNGGETHDNALVALNKSDWISYGAARSFANSRHKWQVSFFVAASLLFVGLLAGVGYGVFAWQQNIMLQSKLAFVQSDLADAKQTISDNLQTVGGLKLKINRLTSDLAAAARPQVIDRTDQKPAPLNEPVAKSR